MSYSNELNILHRERNVKACGKAIPILGFVLFMIPLMAGQYTGYRLSITITTTSDWCRLEVTNSTVIMPLDYEILVNNSPNADIHYLNITQPGNTDQISVKYHTFLLEDDCLGDLPFTITKGDWGDVLIHIQGTKDGAPTTLVDFGNYGSTPNDPTNKKTFSIPISLIQNLDKHDIQVSQPDISKTLFAFHYPWYGSPDGPHGDWFHWDPGNHYNSTHQPLLGYYDSGSAEVQRQHFSWAEVYGLDVFICSWWGIDTYEDKRFVELLNQALNTPIKLTVYLEASGEMQNAEAEDRPDIVKRYMRYILNNYAPHPSFFRYNDDPVIFLYGFPLSLMSRDMWDQVVADIRASGYDFFISVDSYNMDIIQIFDGFHTYNPMYHTRDELRGIFRQNLVSSYYWDKVYAPTILPGYDDTVIRSPGSVVSREDGQFYQDQWQVVVETRPDWVLITSWNEWHEGTEIEPTVEYGMQYLELTQTGRMSWDSTYTNISQEPRLLPLTPVLEPPYPNPFNTSTNLSFTLPGPGHVKITLFTLTGQKVEILMDESLPAGRHTQTWIATELPSGVYLCQLLISFGKQKISKIQKIILMK